MSPAFALTFSSESNPNEDGPLEGRAFFSFRLSIFVVPDEAEVEKNAAANWKHNDKDQTGRNREKNGGSKYTEPQPPCFLSQLKITFHDFFFFSFPIECICYQWWLDRVTSKGDSTVAIGGNQSDGKFGSRLGSSLWCRATENFGSAVGADY
jgi:hypothetical protein